MSELKTKLNDGDVRAFIESTGDEQKIKDSLTLLEIFTRVTHEDAKMWGKSIIGFGAYHYKSERIRQEGDWMLTGFSPRKQNLTLYIMDGFDRHSKKLEKLGKHKVSVGCLYINKLTDVDLSVLEEIISDSFRNMTDLHKNA